MHTCNKLPDLKHSRLSSAYYPLYTIPNNLPKKSSTLRILLMKNIWNEMPHTKDSTEE